VFCGLESIMEGTTQAAHIIENVLKEERSIHHVLSKRGKFVEQESLCVKTTRALV